MLAGLAACEFIMDANMISHGKLVPDARDWEATHINTEVLASKNRDVSRYVTKLEAE